MHGTWWAGVGSLHCFAQQGRRQEGFSTWHPLQLLDGLSEDATRQGQRLLLQGLLQGQAGDRVVPSQPGCGSVVLVPTGSDSALELKGRHTTCCQPAPTAPEGRVSSWHPARLRHPPGPAGHQLLPTLVASSPPFPWAQPKELTKPFERGPQRQLLEVIIFFRLFFLFPC